ncbi:hypothetical protein DCC39_10275 [Pueribacillus theae]|uniref:Peptidase S74 domain-containing protein n=1 Tax=Pueribacillus theae TaxID=2171751 RepID=A0A2U1K1E6_9BACI|nr:hypothetical protein [Pueribacillus theae]PWA11075.1 hypothetical protein DCC39_10275 [Pueribacillus theae]
MYPKKYNTPYNGNGINRVQGFVISETFTFTLAVGDSRQANTVVSVTQTDTEAVGRFEVRGLVESNTITETSIRSIVSRSGNARSETFINSIIKSVLREVGFTNSFTEATSYAQGRMRFAGQTESKTITDTLFNVERFEYVFKPNDYTTAFIKFDHNLEYHSPVNIEQSVLQTDRYNGVSITKSDGFLALRDDELVETVVNATVGIAIQTRSSVNDPWKAKLYADTSGNLHLDGTLVAADGIFTGSLQGVDGTFTGTLQAANGSFTGNLLAASGTFTGELLAASGSFSGNLLAASGTFSGDLQAAGGSFTGELRAASGTFAGTLQAVDGVFTGTLDAVDGNFIGQLNGASGTFVGDLVGGRVIGGRFESHSGGVMTLDPQGIKFNNGRRTYSLNHIMVETNAVGTNVANVYLAPLRGYEARVVSYDDIPGDGHADSYHYERIRTSGVIAPPNQNIVLYTGLEGRCINNAGTAYMPFRASSFPTGSLVEYKENITVWEESALDLINSATIYEYQLKTELEQGIARNRQGLVIGKGFSTPEGIIDGDGVEQYLMNTWSWKAIQELSSKIAALEQKLVKECCSCNHKK